jgi:hypothetical protein
MARTSKKNPAPQAPAPATVKTRAEWVIEIRAAHTSTVEAILKLGLTLIAAKKDLDQHGEWLNMIAYDLPFTSSVAQRLMKIAADPKIANAARAQLLPASWTALYELAKLPAEMFDAAVALGKIDPKMTRDDVKAIAADSAFDPAKTKTIPFEITHRVIRFNDGKITEEPVADADVVEGVPSSIGAVASGSAPATALENPADTPAPAARKPKAASKVIADTTASDAAADSDEHPSYSAIYLADAFKHVVEFPGALPEVIDLVGRENFRNLIATLQAAYDGKCGAARADLTSASADHADDEDAGPEQDAAAIAAEASAAKRWMN